MSTATLLARGPARSGTGKFSCPKCAHAPFSTAQGLAMHDGRVHTGKIKAFREKGTKRKYTRRMALYSDLQVAPVKRGPGRPRLIRTPQDLAEAVLERRAAPTAPPAPLKCPKCAYDLDLLLSSSVPSVCCPGCATTFQAMIDRLSPVLLH